MDVIVVDLIDKLSSKSIDYFLELGIVLHMYFNEQVVFAKEFDGKQTGIG
jgi:hypothetical protein